MCIRILCRPLIQSIGWQIDGLAVRLKNFPGKSAHLKLYFLKMFYVFIAAPDITCQILSEHYPFLSMLQYLCFQVLCVFS